MKKVSRRDFLKAGGLTLLGTAGAAALGQAARTVQAAPPAQNGHNHEDAMAMAVGEVNHARNGFNPTDILTDFNYGTVSTLEDGRTLREYEITTINKEIEVVPGIVYPAWTFNGRIPGPTIRCTEGDLILMWWVNANDSAHHVNITAWAQSPKAASDPFAYYDSSTNTVHAPHCPRPQPFFDPAVARHRR